jgi:hypothetical protein
LAKDPDNLAAEFETENTGGLLSGFLAEEDEFDRRALWRLGSWGVAAVGAVVVAVMANQSSMTFQRDQVAAANLARQAQQLQQLAKDNHNDARRLASAIDTLNTDRDRLYSRVSTLEQGLDSVTGAITRQAAPPSAMPPASAAPATPASQNATAPAVSPVATMPPPTSDKPTADKPPSEKPTVVDKPAATDKSAASPDKVTAADKQPTQPVAAKPQATADKPAAADKQVVADKPALADKLPPNTATADSSLPVIASSVPEPAKQETAKTDNADAPSPSTPLMSAKSFMAPPDPAAARLMEPSKPAASDVAVSPIPDVAAAAPETDADEADTPKAKIQRTEFGVDLGTANSINGLRALWRGLLKSKSNVALTTLKPIIVIKESTNGLGMQLRLVAGPLNDAGTAAKICAGLSLNQRTCDTAIYDGQRLTLKPDDEPAAAKPVQQQRRRVAPKRAAAAAPVATPAVEEPKKPEPTTFSSLFGRKNQ